MRVDHRDPARNTETVARRTTRATRTTAVPSGQPAARTGTRPAHRRPARCGVARSFAVTKAIDVGPCEGAAWLEANGNRWGLCRTYDNEWRHFELATLPGFGCPARLPDAAGR